MLIAIILIILGLLLILKAFGIAMGVGSWSLIGGIILLAIGIKMMRKRGACPMCSGMWYSGKIHDKMHEHCDCNHDHDTDNQDHH